jgi:PmbA protein
VDINKLLSASIKDGVTSEVFYSETKSTSIGIFNREVSAFTRSDSKGVGIRVIAEGKSGSAFTEKVTPEEIERCLTNAVENSGYGMPDKGNVIYESTENFYSDRYLSEDLHSVSLDEKKNFALALENAAYEADSRINNVSMLRFVEIGGMNVIRNSAGLAKEQKISFCYAFAYVTAKEGDDTQIGLYGQAVRNFNDLNYKIIADKAVDRAVSILGAREINSGIFPILFSNGAASSLLGAFISHPESPFYGENIQKGRSKLKDRVGHVIANENLTVIDDPHDFGPGCRDFDDDGIQTKRTVIIENGRLVTILHNLYSAAREGVYSTGHGSRGGFSGGTGTEIWNPRIPDGDKTEAELIGEIGKGIYIINIDGLHAGTDAITGDFSLSAKGFMIEGGEKAFPVRNITIAGNFYELIMDINGIADNRRTDGFGNFSSPSILIKKLSVSGR